MADETQPTSLADYSNAVMPAAGIAYDYSSRRKGRKLFEEDRERMEEKNRIWYERQRSDALADWQKQADYDSPAEQMKRLKAAGINPHLAFGKGAGENTSGVIRSTDVGSNVGPQPTMDMTLDPGNKLLEYAKLQNINAQTENTKVATTNAAIETSIKGLIAIGKSIDNEKGLVDKEVKQRTADFLVDWFRTRANIGGHMDSIYLEKAFEAGPQEKARTANMQGDTLIKEQLLKNLKSTEMNQKWELWAKRHGLDGNDPVYLKSFLKFMITGDLGE